MALVSLQLSRSGGRRVDPGLCDGRDRTAALAGGSSVASPELWTPGMERKASANSTRDTMERALEGNLGVEWGERGRGRADHNSNPVEGDGPGVLSRPYGGVDPLPPHRARRLRRTVSSAAAASSDVSIDRHGSSGNRFCPAGSARGAQTDNPGITRQGTRIHADSTDLRGSNPYY